jgi:acyl carrier protein
MIEDRVIKIIEELINEEVKITDNFMELEIDSIDVVDIVVDLETEFKIQIPDHCIPDLNSVKDCVKVVKQFYSEKNI